MVALLPKTTLNNLRIDTVERAIVFSGLALRAAIVGEDNSNNNSRDVGINVKINRDNTAELAIDATLSFDSFKFHSQGGNLFQNILSFNVITYDLSTKLNFTIKPTIPSIPRIPDHDEGLIDSFEKYFCYHAFILLSSIENKNDGTVTISFFKSSPDTGKLKVACSIPLDLEKWLLGDNYLNSIQRIVNSYDEPTIQQIIIPTEPTDNTLGLLTNDELLTNTQLLINAQSVTDTSGNVSLLSNSQLLTNDTILVN